MSKRKMSDSEEHANWSTEQLREFLKGVSNVGYISNYFKHMKGNIIRKTSFLEDHYPQNKITFSVRVKMIVDDILDANQLPTCRVCGERKAKFARGTLDFEETCYNRKCVKQVKVERTRKAWDERYGGHPLRNEAFLEKRKRTNVERYGGSSPAASEEVKAKIKATNVERYGVEYVTQNDEIRKRQQATLDAKYGKDRKPVIAKQKKTMKSKYGVDFAIHVPGVKDKIKATNELRYGGHPSKSESIRTKIKLALEKRYGSKSIKKPAEYEQDGSVTVRKRVNNEIDTSKNTSLHLQEVVDYLRSLDVEVVTQYRDGLDGKEIDIYMPDYDVGIEYNGLYWHCELFRGAQYHLSKTKIAKSEGIRLIHLFEDEWQDRKFVVKEKLKFMLGIRSDRVFARKCKVQHVSHQTLRPFYDNNHIQGHGPGSTALTLTHNDTIVAAMSFRKTGKAGEVELIRYATSKSVVGGFSKLLKHSIRVLKDQGISRIVSFADKRWSVGDVYHNCGFVHEYDTSPDYQYVVGQRRERKQKFRRNRLPSILKNFDPDKSEIRNMNDHGYYRIFDCGLMKFSMAI